jgi:hypothetical protein
VTVRIIEFLEEVDVDHHDAARPLMQLKLLAAAAHAVVKCASIIEPRERVGASLTDMYFNLFRLLAQFLLRIA